MDDASVAASAAELAAVDGGTLLYMHIPKAAGTSMRKALGRAYPRRERAWVYDPLHVWGAISAEHFTDLSEERRRELRLVFGHFRYGFHRFLPQPARYVTLLRDPVERVVSLYAHYLRQAGLRGYLDVRRYLGGGRVQAERELVRRSGATLESWVFEGRRVEVDNGMVRVIAARDGVPFGQCPDDLLAEAVAHVDGHFAALLVQDDVTRSMGILESLTGRSLARLPRENVNRRRAPLEALDPGLRERIAELNRLDVQLHELARQRLPETYARLVG